MTYKEQLLDPRWQKRRLEKLSRDNFTCQKCLDRTSTLHVHHRYYITGRLAWEYESWELLTLCVTCHEIEELIIKQKNTLISNLVKEGYDVPKRCPACGNYDKAIINVGEINCWLCSYSYELEKIENIILTS